MASHGTIGMIMLKGDWEREYYAYPDIFTIGCAGRITSLDKLPDSRFNVQLEAISEFQVKREIHSYRQAEVQWCPSGRRLLGLEPSEMNSLHDLLVAFSQRGHANQHSGCRARRVFQGSERPPTGAYDPDLIGPPVCP
jgi:Lon protease-like protein